MYVIMFQLSVTRVVSLENAGDFYGFFGNNQHSLGLATLFGNIENMIDVTYPRMISVVKLRFM